MCFDVDFDFPTPFSISDKSDIHNVFFWMRLIFSLAPYSCQLAAIDWWGAFLVEKCQSKVTSCVITLTPDITYWNTYCHVFVSALLNKENNISVFVDWFRRFSFKKSEVRWFVVVDVFSRKTSNLVNKVVFTSQDLPYPLDGEEKNILTDWRIEISLTQFRSLKF